MKFKGLGAFIRRYFFNPEWRCAACGKEIFGGGHFCAECLAKLPFISGYICGHCGRPVPAPAEYCEACKNRITELDCGRSVFRYEYPVSGLILRFKYGGQKYLGDMFAEYISSTYFKNYFAADFICYVPMTKKSEKKRGYNHGRLLAEKVSLSVGVPVEHCLVKVKETKRQAKLSRKERVSNLSGAFRVADKKAVNGKTALIVDDVTTTGATAQELCTVLKKAGARRVLLLTAAEVTPGKEDDKRTKPVRKLFKLKGER